MRHTNVEKGITKQQQRFADEYIIDLNGTLAAERAGYSKKTAPQQAVRLLRNVKVQEAIQKALKKRQQRTQITADMVLNEYAKIAFSNIQDYAEWIANSVDFINSKQIERDKLAAVESVSEGKDGLKIKLHSKLNALDALARHLGIDKTNTIPDDDETDIDNLIDCLSGSVAETFADEEADECDG